MTLPVNGLGTLKIVARCIRPISSGDVHKLVYAVPKFHLPAHVLKCQVERTDREAPEQGWSYINGVASSTKEMGPGSRQDTLDDPLDTLDNHFGHAHHFGDYNWRKFTITTRHEQFSAALPPESVLAWTKLCQKWEKDRTQQNPFMNLRNGIW